MKYDRLMSEAKAQNKDALDSITQQEHTDDEVIDENEILDNMTFSYSNLSAFETCPYSWYLKYIEHEEGEDNVYGQFGTCCHKVLEQFVKGELQEDELTMAYIDEFETTVSPANEWNVNTVAGLFDAGFTYFSDCTLKKLHLENCTIVGAEKMCSFEVASHCFVGFIDLLIQDAIGDIIVIDHKSGEYPLTKSGAVKVKCQEKFVSYKRQLYLYSKAVYEEFHKFPKTLAWNFFKTNDWLIVPFDEKEYEDTLKWAENVIDDIYLTVDFNAKPNFFFCKNICDFRRICDEQYNEVE